MTRLPITVRLTVAFAAAMLLMLKAAALFVALRLRADLDDRVNNSLRARNVAALSAYQYGTQQIEVARFHLHSQQLRVAAAAGSYPRVTGEVAALEWIRDRLPLDGDQARMVNEALVALRSATDSRNLSAAADHGTRLASLMRDLSVR